jgi:inorganic pyrophosphatase
VNPPEAADDADAPEVEVLVEVPRGCFLKRDPAGRIHFVSPLPCPYNYGAVPSLLGLEGDLLDAVVLGPRLPFGTRLRVRAWGAVTLTDRGLADDKLICSAQAPSARQIAQLLRFFGFYARCKALRNTLRRRPGRNACDGWHSARWALSRARPVGAVCTGAPIPF